MIRMYEIFLFLKVKTVFTFFRRSFLLQYSYLITLDEFIIIPDSDSIIEYNACR